MKGKSVLLTMACEGGDRSIVRVTIEKQLNESCYKKNECQVKHICNRHKV